MGKTQNLQFDHLAIPVKHLDQSMALFKLLGFKKEWYRPRIGSSETAMKTAVMTRGRVKFALMEGIDSSPDAKGKRIVSQVTEYYRRFGMFPQHIALRCDNLENLVQEWHRKGVRFLTEDQNQKPRILKDIDGGIHILQCFTYPINGGWFLELKQILRARSKPHEKFEEFRDENVEGLWKSLDKALKEGWLFQVNIFGHKSY